MPEMPEEIEICVIDDDPSQRKLIARMLEKHGYAVQQAGDGVEGLERIRKTRPKVILSDWMMPGLDGLELCEAVRSDPTIRDTYFILLTSRDTIDDKTSALETGADDFLTKPCNVREMIARVRVGIRMWELQRDLRQAAITDGLTGLYNHRHFSQLLDAEYERARRSAQPLTFMIADLDHFKSVNDTYGHETGNVVLRCVAEALKNVVRKYDILARYGGEEFAIVLPETALKNGVELAERLRVALPAALPPGTLEGRTLTASFGVASIDDPRVTSVQQLIDLADQALYVAKQNGRNQVAVCLKTAMDAKEEAAPERRGPEREADVLRGFVKKLTDENHEIKRQMVHAFVQALGLNDDFVVNRARTVKMYARSIANQMGVQPDETSVLGQAALLHEIRRLEMRPQRTVPDVPISPERFHVDTLQILDQVQAFNEALKVIHHLSESFDGFGKPEGLRAEDIPLGSRILRVADAFADLTINGACECTGSLAKAVQQLTSQSGRLYDPAVMQALAACVESDGEAWLLHLAHGMPEPEAVS